MTFTPYELPGLLLVEPTVFADPRGFFLEAWNQRRYADAGLEAVFVQDNFSLSRRGVLRVLHFQNPSPQGKLVSVLQGEIYDVAVDLRRRSPTFRQWCGLTLSGENKRQFFLPPGFAHGFVVLSETALFHYKCTEYYAPQHELTIRWDDPDLGIRWPVETPILSTRDSAAPSLRNLTPDQLF